MARKKRKRWPRIVALGALTTLVAGMLILALVDKFAPDQTYVPKSMTELPAKVISAVMQPLQKGFASVSNGVTGYLENWKLRKTIEIEYNKLRAQNDELTYEALRNDELEQENDRLRNMLNVFDEKKKQNPIMATVIAKETGNWFQMFEIDKGKEHGIKENMAVINARGLIGYIYNVFDTSAQVISIIDNRAGVSGIISSTRDQGVVRGTLGYENEATCRMYYLPVDLVPRPGDTVVTSGIGLPFPKGIPIGEVRESTRYMAENKQYVVIEPYVDFQHLEEVIVLVYEAAAETNTEGSDGQVVYEHQPLDTPRPVPDLDADTIDDPNLGAVTAPPRATRKPSSISAEDGQQPIATGDPDHTLEPGATPTPNPELDRLLQEELEAEMAMEAEAEAEGLTP